MKLNPIHRFPLAVKMAITMLIVVICAWFVVQKFEVRILRDFFLQYHIDALEYDAQEELLRFIKQLRARRNSVRSMLIQKNFYDYMHNFGEDTGFNEETDNVLYYSGLPPWFPPRQLSRTHLVSSYALLTDSSGKVREVYSGIEKPIPESLLHPYELLPRLRNTESVLVYIEGEPYQLIIKHYKYSGDRQQGTLMFAFPINSKFLRASQGTILGNHIVALLDTNSRIITSSNPDMIRKGVSLESLENDYLTIQKSFFAYGESEIDMKFISLAPKSDVNSIVDSVLAIEFKHAVAYALTFILSSSLVVLLLSSKLRKVTGAIVDFLQNNLGTKYTAPPGRDELYTLEKSFHHMENEILQYQNHLKQRSAELLVINKALQAEIVERIQAKDALAESEIKFRTLVETTSDWVWEVDENSVYTYSSPHVFSILGYKPEEIIGKTPFDFMPAEEAERIRDIFYDIAKDRRPFEVLENVTLHKEGRQVVLETSGVPIFDKNSKFCGYRGMDRNITERKQSELALLQEKHRLEEVTRYANCGLFLLDDQSKITYANSLAERWFGPMDTIRGEYCWKVFKLKDPENECAGLKVLRTGEISRIETPIIIDSGEEKFFYEIASPVRNIDGRIYQITALIIDITERKKAEEKIKASLKEKEVLLKEIHHRAKNNMQVISSLLNLQSDKITDKKYIDMFHDSLNRIKSMALVHEKLYQSKDLTNIYFNDYVKSLVHGLLMFYGINPNSISVKIDIQEIDLSIDTAIPCGLIINELVSNSLKHAFPNNTSGEIKILFSKTDVKNDDSQYVLIVKDNGIGIPLEYDINESGSLGLQLVTNLAQHQLQGSLKLNRDNGTEFIINFKKLKYNKRI